MSHWTNRHLVAFMTFLILVYSPSYSVLDARIDEASDGRHVPAAQSSCSGARRDVSPVWQRQLDGYNVGELIVANGTLFVGANYDSVYAVDAATGTNRWNIEVDQRTWPGPALSGDDEGRLYVGGGELYALDMSNGEELWRFDVDGGFPTVSGGVVYIGDRDFYAIDAHSGSMLWSFDVKRGVDVHPAVSGDAVYFSTGEGVFYALGKSSGQERWRFDLGQVVQIASSPALKDGAIYFGGPDGNVYALDQERGLELWRFETGFSITASPVILSGVLYIGSGDGNVYALDLSTGQERWRFETQGGVYASPIVLDGVVFVGSTDCNVYAIDANTGNELWRFSIGLPVQSPLVVDRERLYVGSPDGTLYALPAKPELGIGVGALVQMDDVIVRGGPSPIGVERTVVNQGERVSVTDGPEKRGDDVWWEITLHDGTRGWVLEESILPTWP